MPGNKFFISDTHFFHHNIIGFAGRPFKSAAEMNEYMVDRWNRVVRPGDEVYHLGDVAFKTHEKYDELNDLMNRLNGTKYLALGNHDRLSGSAKFKLWNYFQEINYWYVFKKEGFFASHVPLPKVNFRETKYQVHGHIHQLTLDDPNYINVCVEHTKYIPVPIDDILDIIRSRQT